MARIALIGAHGKVARQLIPLLADRGDEVTAVLRNPDQVPDIEGKGVTPLVADVTELGLDDLEDALRGHDAVVWAAGAGGGDAARTYALDRDAAIRTVDAAERAEAPRFVMVSWIGSVADHGVDPDSDFFPYADAKWAADEHVRASSLQWTVLGPGTLADDEASGRIVLDPSGQGQVARADVAAVIAEALAGDDAVGKTVRFGGSGADGHDGVPVAEALRAA